MKTETLYFITGYDLRTDEAVEMKPLPDSETLRELFSGEHEFHTCIAVTGDIYKKLLSEYNLILNFDKCWFEIERCSNKVYTYRG